MERDLAASNTSEYETGSEGRGVVDQDMEGVEHEDQADQMDIEDDARDVSLVNQLVCRATHSH